MHVRHNAGWTHAVLHCAPPPERRLLDSTMNELQKPLQELKVHRSQL
jgi:hypothetical protein